MKPDLILLLGTVDARGFKRLLGILWQVLGVCDDTGEDPRCHNSVCYLGLCTSVSDHLIYLGSHMYNGIPAC